MSTETSISESVRRQFILAKQGLWPGRRWNGKEGTAEALRAVEAVQIDPVSVLVPSHDIALWGRVTHYQPEYLDSLLYVERRFFDYGGALFIYPMEELPYWRVIMERHKSETRWAEFAQANPALLDEVRQAVRARGPLRKRDLEGKAVNHYRASKDTGVALHYLWLTGELMSHSRQGKERVYDFLENVAPAHLQWSASEKDAIEFFTRKAVSQLGFVLERDFRRILKSVNARPVDVKETKSKLAEMVEAGQLTSVRLENHKEPLYFLASDATLLDHLSDGLMPSDWPPITTTTVEEVIFLSPLEYVSARGRAKEIFDFDYIWEIYKPAPQRQYGPYTMPVLYGDQLVARMDAKLERQSKALLINGVWLEEWLEADDAFYLAFAKGLARFRDFLGAERVDLTVISPTILGRSVGNYL
ncbi:MAG: winged helix DNA-binding domain-containing protein [Chloroflexota bacterium]|nr:winged helix DNA-binding domain-containing protein [Chloroflexota bacterium]